MRRLLLGAVIALAALAVLTWWAGEQTEVVRLRTFDAAGRSQETKMWVVDHEGAPWVRVANPQRGWYRRLLANPNVELVRRGETKAYTAEPHDSPELAAALDAAFRAKYGLVDGWYGLLLRRHAIPVKLVPAEAAR